MTPTIEPILSDLEPRVCACGAATGSPALDQCADCERGEVAL